jgi:protein-S-isoprenylcysteine O-methyltransferase Ste14
MPWGGAALLGPMKQRIIFLLKVSLCGAAIGVLIVKVGGQKSVGDFFGHAQVPWLVFDGALKGHWPLFACSVLAWVAFSFYWEVAAKNAAEAQRTEARSSRAVHVFLVNVALLLELIPIRALGRYLPVSSFIMLAGLAVQAIGMILAVWARRHLGRNWSGAIAIKVEHKLIRSGPYRFLRHPIYTGLLAMYVGTAVVAGEWLALIGVAMVTFAYWRKIRLEEAALDTAFGADYLAYRQATWALLPGLF